MGPCMANRWLIGSVQLAKAKRRAWPRAVVLKCSWPAHNPHRPHCAPAITLACRAVDQADDLAEAPHQGILCLVGQREGRGSWLLADLAAAAADGGSAGDALAAALQRCSLPVHERHLLQVIGAMQEGDRAQSFSERLWPQTALASAPTSCFTTIVRAARVTRPARQPRQRMVGPR